MQQSRQTAHILAVEDCPEDARLIKAAIKRADVDVSLHVVGDGVEAVRYLRGDGKYRNRREFPSPTFVLCDVKMPEMDGLQLLRWVRSHPDCSGIPMIVLSACDFPHEVEQAYRLGANAYLTKPSTLEEFTGLVRATYEFWSRCTSLPVADIHSGTFKSRRLTPGCDLT